MGSHILIACQRFTARSHFRLLTIGAVGICSLTVAFCGVLAAAQAADPKTAPPTKSTTAVETPSPQAALAVPPGTTVVLIDQLVSSAFVPESTFLLAVDGRFGFRKIPGTFIDQGVNEAAPQERKLLLGSSVTLAGISSRSQTTGAGENSAEPAEVEGDSKTPIYFSFFLKGNETTFATTPVRSWGGDLTAEGALSIENVRTQVVALKARKDDLAITLREVDESLKSLRKQASQIAGVDEIVDLKLELSRVRGFGDTSGAEQQRLQQLIRLGRSQKDGPQVDQRRYELALQLQGTAQKTAMSLRLQERRKELARATLERKLSLVKQMAKYDPTAIAQDIVRIRKQNAELQKQLGESQPVDAGDQF